MKKEHKDLECNYFLFKNRLLNWYTLKIWLLLHLASVIITKLALYEPYFYHQYRFKCDGLYTLL